MSDTVEVRLGRTGHVALIDAEDLPKLEGWRFYRWKPRTREGTAFAIAKKFIKGQVTQTWLHRIIAGVTDPQVKVEHIDGDGLNCRKSNLKERHPPS